MPVKLPCKDVWRVYRTAVLKYPLTKGTGCDMMGVLITTIHKCNLSAKELSFWHNRTCEL